MQWKVTISFYHLLLSFAQKPLGTIHKRRRQLGGEEWSKIGQNCLQIVLKNCRHEGGGVKIPEKLPTLFMDGLQPEFYRVHRRQRTDFRNSAQKSSRLRLMTLIVLNSYLIMWSEGSEIPQQLVGILSHRLTSRFPVLFKNIFWPFLMRRQTHDIDNWFDLLEFWRTSKRNRTLVAVPAIGAVCKLR